MKQYDREKLYQEVWKEPVSIVSKRYGVSDTALAKVCRRMNIPLPPRGYWAKTRAGQSVGIPALPNYIPNSSKVTSQNTNNTRATREKSSIQTESANKTIQRVNAFLHCHMVEQEDILHHFRYLISCLKKEGYSDYSEEYRTRRAAFLHACMKQIKAAHLPALLMPWTCYKCDESTSGFSLIISKIIEMDIEDDVIEYEVSEEICDIMEFPYDYVTIAEYAKLHNISEKTIIQWIENGELSGAIFEDEVWKIPELELKPEGENYPAYLDLYPDDPVNIPAYPLLSQCSKLRILPDGGKYCLQYYGKDHKWIGQLLISRREKDSLMGELLKQGVSYDHSAYEISLYPVNKHHETDIRQWHDIPSYKENAEIRLKD